MQWGTAPELSTKATHVLPVTTGRFYQPFTLIQEQIPGAHFSGAAEPPMVQNHHV